MMQFDQCLPQALMDANLADLESIFQQPEDVEVHFSPRYLRAEVKMLAAPWKWLQCQDRSKPRRRLNWRMAALVAALLLLSACAAAAFAGQFSQWFPWLGVNPGAPEASEDLMARMGTVIEQSQTVDDLTVTLHAAVWDGETLRLSIVVEKPGITEEWDEEFWRESWIYREKCYLSMRQDQLEDYSRKEIQAHYAEMEVELPPEELEKRIQNQLTGNWFTSELRFNLFRQEGDRLFFEATLPLADYVEQPELTLHMETLATVADSTELEPDVVILEGPYDFTFTLDKKIEPVIYEGMTALTAEKIPLEFSRIKLTASSIETEFWSPNETHLEMEQVQAVGPQGLWTEDGAYVDFSGIQKSSSMTGTLDGITGELRCQYPHVVDPQAVTAVNLGGTRVELWNLKRCDAH